MNKLILEQEWKIKHSTSYSHLSFLSYMGVITTSFVMIVFCYCCCCCCCKCCKTNFPSFFKWWKDNNPCTTIIIKPKIVNLVHSSRESLRLPTSKNCRIRGSMQEDALEEGELVTLKTCSRQMVPSGKR